LITRQSELESLDTGSMHVCQTRPVVLTVKETNATYSFCSQEKVIYSFHYFLLIDD
jgi:(2Fe-2S) ferredoxin